MISGGGGKAFCECESCAAMSTMDPQAIRVLKAAPLVLFGAYASYLLFGRAGEPIEAFGNHCQTEGPLYSWRIGLKPVDDFVCVLVQSFEQGLSTREGTWVTGYLISTLVSVFAFMGVEGSRVESGWLLSLIPLHVVLFQLIGISVVVPAIWLPCYVLYDSGDRTPSGIWRKRISVVRVGAIGFSVVLLKLSAAAILFPFENKGKETAILIFQMCPILVAFLWLPFFTTDNSSQISGHKWVKGLHFFQAEAGFMWHLIGILFVIRDPQLPWRVFKLLHSWTNSEFQMYILLLEVLVLLLAFLYVIVLEDGVNVATLVVIGSVFCGPASALSLYFAYREQQLVYVATQSGSSRYINNRITPSKLGATNIYPNNIGAKYE